MLHLLLPWLLIIAAPPLLLLLARRKWMRMKLPPGPRPLPFIGNLHQLGVQPHRSLHRLALKHGPLMYLQLGSVPTVVMSSAEVLQEALKAHDLALSGRPTLYSASRLSYGNLDIAFAPYGEHWRQARKLFMQELLGTKRVRSFRSIREEEVASLVAAITDRSSSATPTAINLSEMVITLINKIVCRATLGSRSGGQMRFCELVTEAEELLGGFCAADFFPWMEWIHRFDGLKARLDRVFRGLDECFEKLIEEHLEDEGKMIDGHDCCDEDMIQVLLRLEKDPMSRNTLSSRNHIKALLADIFIAGIDTSYTTITWVMSELMLNPYAMKTAQDEVRKLAGGKRGKLLGETDLRSLDYLRSVIKETMRLHPPAPFLVPRETTAAFTMNGYDIPRKTRVLINATAIGLDERRWANAREFKPERFSGEIVGFGGQDFDLIPFGVGRRICPGLDFAVVMVELALANLLCNFDWELQQQQQQQPGSCTGDGLDMEEVFGLTVHRKNPLLLVAKPFIAA